jgi:hypothetical protein
MVRCEGVKGGSAAIYATRSCPACFNTTALNLSPPPCLDHSALAPRNQTAVKTMPSGLLAVPASRVRV